MVMRRVSDKVERFSSCFKRLASLSSRFDTDCHSGKVAHCSKRVDS